MNFVEHCPTPPAQNPNRKRSPRHRRTTPSTSPKHATVSPRAPPARKAESDLMTQAEPLGTVRSPRHLGGASSRSYAAGSKTPSPREYTTGTSGSGFMSVNHTPNKEQLANIDVRVRKAPSLGNSSAGSKSPSGESQSFSAGHSNTTPLGSTQGLRPIVPSRRARSASPSSPQSPLSIQPLSPSLPTSPTSSSSSSCSSSNIIEITHGSVLGATTTIRELSLEPVMLSGNSSGSESSGSPRSGSLAPLNLSGSMGRSSMSSSERSSSLSKSDGGRRGSSRGGTFGGGFGGGGSLTTSLGGKSRPPSGSGASGAAATKPSPPVTLAKLRGVNSSNAESTLVMSRGRGDIGGGGPTVPMMPIMSPAGNTAGKKVDYAKYLSPVDPKPRSGNRSRKSGDSRGRGSSPPYPKKLEQVMPGIHSSSSNNANDVHVRREVEW